jgi:hypothetical protein
MSQNNTDPPAPQDPAIWLGLAAIVLALFCAWLVYAFS